MRAAQCLPLLALAALATVAAAPARAQQPPAHRAPDLTGAWLGRLHAGPVPLQVVLHFTRRPDGGWTASLDSPDQGAAGIPAAEAALEGDSVRVLLPAIGAEYRGRLDPGGARIAGTFSQRGARFPLELERTASPPSAARPRPQDPKEPLPYLSEEVTFENPAAGIRLAGTFTRPRAPGRYPAALLITGSGPQNRDEELFGHRPFRVLADHLTRQGIAVLRVDDRGVGGSTGRFQGATSLDFASDVRAGVAYLKTRPDVDPRAIGLVGHSEGGLIAPIVAAESDDVAWIVLLAGPGLRGDSILLLQSALVGRAAGLPEPAIARNQELQRRLFALLREEPSDTAAAARARTLIRETLAALPPEERRAAGAPAEGEAALDALAAQQARELATPWFRFFIDYDPRPTLRRVRVPVLALAGSLDLQVPAGPNLAAIRQALEEGGNRHVTTLELPGLNHLFQTAKTGAPAEYAEIEETFAPAALERIAAWIREVTGRR